MDIPILKRKYFQKRYQVLQQVGQRLGFIKNIEKELLIKAGNLYFCGIPILVQLSAFNDGKCYDCSYMLTLYFDDGEFKLIRGHLSKYAKLYNTRPDHDKEFGHGWVERKGWIYDTTFKLKYKKWFCKLLFSARFEHVITFSESMQDTYYQQHRMKRDEVKTDPLIALIVTLEKTNIRYA